ncbi:MAG: hypothetical protein P1U53_02135 [Sulfitobacter sp.]|nr:hypothetical protein [Sulfitobacter sp.]
MTDASYIPPFAWREDSAKVRDSARTAPAPQPIAPPVFIYDCVTPIGGETLLSLLMKRAMKDDDQP